MAVLLASGSATSVAANTKTSNLITGRNQFLGKGKITLVAKASATGLNTSLYVQGTALADDQVVAFTGTAGTISVKDNVIVEQAVNGGTAELYFRNTTGGAITIDYFVYFTPM